jgi:hypothetical protein
LEIKSIAEPVNNPTLPKTEKKDKPSRKRIMKSFFSKIINSNIFISFMTFLTIIALFSSDIQQAWLPSSVDFSFDVLQTIMLFFFTLEIVMTCLAKRRYINSFFFWLDIVATVSLIQDISFLFNLMLGLNAKYYF